jgi:hypothetical protein
MLNSVEDGCGFLSAEEEDDTAIRVRGMRVGYESQAGEDHRLTHRLVASVSGIPALA